VGDGYFFYSSRTRRRCCRHVTFGEREFFFCAVVDVCEMSCKYAMMRVKILSSAVFSVLISLYSKLSNSLSLFKLK